MLLELYPTLVLLLPPLLDWRLHFIQHYFGPSLIWARWPFSSCNKTPNLFRMHKLLLLQLHPHINLNDTLHHGGLLHSIIRPFFSSTQGYTFLETPSISNSVFELRSVRKPHCWISSPLHKIPNFNAVDFHFTLRFSFCTVSTSVSQDDDDDDAGKNT